MSVQTDRVRVVAQWVQREAWRLDKKSSVSPCPSCTLAELRDTLLPKLISGQLRVPEAEEQFSIIDENEPYLRDNGLTMAVDRR